MPDDDPPSATDHPPVTVAVGVTIVLALTIILVVGVSAVMFELDPDEGAAPETHWEVTLTDPPVLTHAGGDPVDCSRVRVAGELGSGETLCTYFAGELILEGDSAELMAIGDQTGILKLTWEDVELDRNITIFERPVE